MGHLGRASVMVLWPSKATLAKVQARQPAEVLVVPWLADECDAWLRAHSSTPLLGGPLLEKPTIRDPAVLGAMKHLTGLVAVHKQITRPSERDYAIQVLRALIAADRHVDPDELYTWVLANGWTAKGAEELRVLAAEVLAGKQHRIGRMVRPLGRDAIRRWEDGAGK
jgi:hypothetical protein